MSLLVVSDLHCHTAHAFTRRLPDGTDTRLQDILNILDQVERYRIDRRPQTVVMLGDLTHRRHYVAFGLFNRLYARVAALSRQVQVVLVCGNHDKENDEDHALDAFRHLPNVVVVGQAPMTVTTAGGGPIAFVPYSYDETQVVRWIDGLPAGIPVMAHFAAEGVPLEADYWLNSVVKLGELARFPFTVFGHVHKPSTQCAGCGTIPLDAVSGPCPGCRRETGRVIYVGAPLHFDFGDAGPRFGLWIDGSTRERLPFTFPPFVTTTWPRIGKPSRPGYLRILHVPPERVLWAQDTARRLGWVDAVALPAKTDQTRLDQAAAGLQVTQEWLMAYVARVSPETAADERRAFVEMGWGYLRGGERWLTGKD